MKRFITIVLTALSTLGAAIASNRTMAVTTSSHLQTMNGVTHRAAEEGADSIADAIVTRADVPVSFKNDEVHPWRVEDSAAVIRGNNQSNYNSTSWLTMKYSSDKHTELSFEWARYNYDYHEPLQVYIDGVYKGNTTSSSYSSKRFYLNAGEHIVAFRDSVGSYNSDRNWSGVKNVKVKEILPLETVVLTEDSKPLTFINDGEWPWTIEDGYIQNSNYGTANSFSRFTTTFTIDKTSKLSYEVAIPYYNTFWTGSYYESYHDIYININETRWDYWRAERDWTLAKIVLEPGTYTVEFLDTIRNTTSNFYARLRNIELTSNWVEVELAAAGRLGVEVLEFVSTLDDVELLKVRGPLNSDDWAYIKQMNNLTALDLTETVFDAVPNYAFDGLSYLSSVKLPEGVKSIGEYAFRGTQIWNIEIPSTMLTIGQYAFAGTRLKSIKFGERSQLQSIGQYAFDGCKSLMEFIMPNTATSIGQYAFSNCTALNKLWFSDLITTINANTCRECNQLTELHLPDKLETIWRGAFYNTNNLRHVELPSSLNNIGYEAFYNCALDSVKLPVTLTYLCEYAFRNCFNLKYIELPSYLENTSMYDNGTRYYGYRENFYNCDAIETIVMRSAAPPAIVSDPFSEARVKSEITLKVPSFAVVNYKLDSYWYQFGSIVEGDDVDYWKITSPLSLTNNRRMQGKPDIDLYYGGQFMVGGNAPMETGTFNLYVNESNPGRLLNTCESLTADSLNTFFSANSETWYFLTPLHDVDLMKVTVSNDASFVFRYYDGSSRATNGTGNSWRNVDNGKLTAGQGYIFQCNKNAVISFPAKTTEHIKVFNTQNVTTHLNAYEAKASADKSWNFVGNPYPCYYDIYYLDFTAPITVWENETYKAYSIVDDNYALRPMQAFFVQKPDAVDNIIFHKAGRQLTSDINHSAAAKVRRVSAYNNRYIFNLALFGDEMKDETRVVINDEASLDYEIERDASKFMSFESAVPQIFTLNADGNGYAINERPLDSGTIRLAYHAGQTGFFTISATRADGNIYLHDAFLNKRVNLNEQDYIFHSEATGGTNETRFTLTFEVEDATGISDHSTLTDEQNADTWYSIDGRHLNGKPTQRGIYIDKRRKVVVK